MFMLNALDDPVVPEYVIKPVFETCKKNENLLMMTTKWGGHLGYHEGIIPNQATYMDKAIIEYFDAVLNLTKTSNLESVKRPQIELEER